MADKSDIEWTEATWNPITGCRIKSPGCTNCYAMKLAGGRLKHHPSRAGLTMPSNAGPVWTGEIRFNEQWLDQPIRWKRPRLIFVCAHSDLFFEGVPNVMIDPVFAVMSVCDDHLFQVLTKRPDRMLQYLSDPDAADRWIRHAIEITNAPCAGQRVVPFSNVWLGVSVEDQTRADEHRPAMAKLSSLGWKTWVSYEPALGPVNWSGWEFLDWMVSGGESGPRARPTHPDWHRSTRDWCAAHGIDYHFKQWGSYLPWEPEHGPCWKSQNGQSEDQHNLFPANIADDPPGWDSGLGFIGNGESHFAFQKVGKKAAGRSLDGHTHDVVPARINC